MPPMMFDPATPQPRVKHSNNEPLRSSIKIGLITFSLLLNPFKSNELFYPCQQDESISKLNGAVCYFSFLFKF